MRRVLGKSGGKKQGREKDRERSVTTETVKQAMEDKRRERTDNRYAIRRSIDDADPMSFVKDETGLLVSPIAPKVTATGHSQTNSRSKPRDKKRMKSPSRQKQKKETFTPPISNVALGNQKQQSKPKFVPPPSVVALSDASNPKATNMKQSKVQSSKAQSEKAFVPPPSFVVLTANGDKLGRTSSSDNPLPTPPLARLDQVERKFDDIYERGEKLGEGAFANVFVGIEKLSKQKYAVKEVDRTKMMWNGKDTLSDEVHNLQKLQQAPFVVQLSDHYMTPRLCYLVLEYMPGGELFDKILEKEAFDEVEARDSSRCILDALSFMHSKNIIHRDLKPENLLLMDHPEGKMHVKLSDFGFSKVMKQPCRTVCGTPGYIAPEILERWPHYDERCDIWSFGVVLFVMLGGYMPFDGEETEKVFERTRNGLYHFHPSNWRLVSAAARDVVVKCLKVNPNRRCGAEKAKSFKWMTERKPRTPKPKLSTASLWKTKKQTEDRKKAKRKDRKQKESNKTPTHERLRELNENFTQYLEKNRADSFVSQVTGGSRTVRSNATQFTEDSPSGEPFSKFYSKEELLGEGGYAKVFRYTHKRTRLSYAVKIIETEGCSEDERATLEDEIKALMFVRGAPHIVSLYDVFREPKRIYMVLKELKGGDLVDRISEKEVYTEREAREVCKTLFQAVDYCHRKRIAHRDIKLDNLLLREKDDDSSLTLVDFGMSKKVLQVNGLTTMCGSALYIAPEIINPNIPGYDTICDMWSVGCVVYTLLCGYVPFDHDDLAHLAELIRGGAYEFHDKYWNHISSSAKALVSEMLQVEPSKRLSAHDALNCEWMGVDSEDLSCLFLSETKEKLSSLRSSDADKAIKAIKALIGANKRASMMSFASVPQRSKVLPAKEQTFEEKYRMGNQIGEGLFASVYHAKDRSTGTKFLVKKVVRHTLHPEDILSVNDEITVLKEISTCDHVIHLKEIYEDPDNTYLVMENVPGDLLIDRLIEQKKFTEFDAKEFIRNLLHGVAFCHKKQIANRNLKLDNLLLPAGSRTGVKITDFEYAKIVPFPNSLRTKCGSEEYVAPEILVHRPAYDVSCDMWTIGVILFIMLGGYYPFRGKTEEDKLKQIRYGDYKFHSKYWKHISDDGKELVKNMMTVDPQRRISVTAALESSWIQATYATLSSDLSENLDELKIFVSNSLVSRGAEKMDSIEEEKFGSSQSTLNLPD